MKQNMQRLKEERNQSDDEIDLRLVVNKIGEGFNALFRKLNYLVQVALKYFLLVSSFFLLGLAAGYGVYYLTKPYYTSSMTLMLANIRNDFIEDQLYKLSGMIDEENYDAVADRLDITLQAASNVKEMKFYNLDQNRIDEDSVLTGSPFRIELSVYDRKLFDSMEPALTSYLENNRYFAKQKRIKQRQVEDMVSKLRNEISSIDSMKTSVSEPKGPVSGFVYGQPIDPTNLYRESITMYKEQVKLEADLERLDNVEVVTGFAPRRLPTGPSLRKYLAIGGAIAVLIGMVLALNMESRKRRRQV
jgi:hypothetical protein